jgi:hypothetical protein
MLARGRRPGTRASQIREAGARGTAKAKGRKEQGQVGGAGHLCSDPPRSHRSQRTPRRSDGNGPAVAASMWIWRGTQSSLPGSMPLSFCHFRRNYGCVDHTFGLAECLSGSRSGKKKTRIFQTHADLDTENLDMDNISIF